VSSARFKKAVKPSEAVLALKPVTFFRYKQELDPKGIPQFGLVAEDVEKVRISSTKGSAGSQMSSFWCDAKRQFAAIECLKHFH